MAPVQNRGKKALVLAVVVIAGVICFAAALRFSKDTNVYEVEIVGTGIASSDASLAAELANRVSQILDSNNSSDTTFRTIPPQPVLRLHDRESSRTAIFSVGLSHNTPTSIFRPATPPAGKGLLVRSTDEKRQQASGLTTVIAEGCDLPTQMKPLLPGNASTIEPCRGAYASAEGIAGVIDVVAVPWGDYDCWSGDRTVCVRTNLKISLKMLLERVRAETGFDTLILPALGTGVGGLSHAAFYEDFAAQYIEQPIENADKIHQIVFSIFDKDWLTNRSSIKSATGEALAKIATSWRTEREKQHDIRKIGAQKRSQLLAIASGLCFGLAILHMISVLSGGVRTFGSLSRFESPKPVIIASFVLLAFPVAIGLHDLIRDALGPPSLLANVGLGILSIPLLLALTFLRTRGEERLKV